MYGQNNFNNSDFNSGLNDQGQQQNQFNNG